MTTQDLLTKLREAIPGAANGQKELLKEIGLALKASAERVAELESEAARLHANNRNLQAAMEEAPLPDAPGSINFKMTDPACKVVGQFTFRFHTPEKAIERFPALVQKLLEAGLVSEDEYIDQRRAARKDAIESDGEGVARPTTTAPATNGEPPVCKYHGPMKASEKKPGSFYCPKKMADGSGYCKEKVG